MKVTWKKTGVGILAVILVSFCFNVPKVEAYDFSDEGYWIKLCSGYVTDQATYNACMAFKQYASDKANDYSQTANSLQDKINKAQGNIDELIKISQQYDSEIASKESEIATLQSSIDTAQASIVQAEEDIEKKQKNMKKRKKIIASQMVDMQSDINTNQFIDFIMGATDLVDMVQRSNGVESITKSQKEQINKLNDEKKQLNLAKKEQLRIKSTLETQQDSLEAAKVAQEDLKRSNDTLKESMEEEVAKLLAQRNAANSAANTLANMKTPSFVESGDIPDLPTGSLIAPIQGVSISRGPDNNGHRGVDWAASKGTPIIAPANCFVVFASTGYGDGYFGNIGPGSGVPAGGGNSVRIIFSVDGTTFAMNFHHMQAASGQALSNNGTNNIVPQGTLLGWVGSSGNSSGPHAHVEMFILNQSVPDALRTWYATGDWQSSAGWGLSTPASGSYGTRINPLSYF